MGPAYEGTTPPATSRPDHERHLGGRRAQPTTFSAVGDARNAATSAPSTSCRPRWPPALRWSLPEPTAVGGQPAAPGSATPLAMTHGVAGPSARGMSGTKTCGRSRCTTPLVVNAATTMWEPDGQLRSFGGGLIHRGPPVGRAAKITSASAQGIPVSGTAGTCDSRARGDPRARLDCRPSARSRGTGSRSVPALEHRSPAIHER